jgi:putative ABC transport system permease protein
MAPFRLLVTRLRRDWWPALLLSVLVGVTALVAAVAPRLFNETADAGLRHEVASARAVERGLQLGRITRIEGGGEGLAPVVAVESEVERALPDSVRSVIDQEALVARSAGWVVPDSTPIRPRFVTFEFTHGLDDLVRLVEGRMPGGSVRQERIPNPTALGAEEIDVSVFEVALSSTTAREMYASVGDRLDMFPDADDPLVGQFGGAAATVSAEVVGIFEVTEPDADIWVGDYALERPQMVRISLETVEVHGTVLDSPDAYGAMLDATPFPMRYAFRYGIDADRFDAGMLEALVTDLRLLTSTMPTFATSADPLRTTLQTALPDLLANYLAEFRASQAVLVTAAIGPAAVALVAIAVLAVLLVRRRQSGIGLLRGRGASAWQVIASHVAEGLLLAVPPAVVAAWLAVLVVEARPSPLTDVGAAAIAAASALLLVGVTHPWALRPLSRFGRETPPSVAVSPRRLAFEALAVVLAIVGVVLLRQRGLTGGGATGELPTVDPFLAAVPALVGLAVGLVTVRIYPYPIRLLEVLASGARGLTPALGLRRAQRQLGSGQLPLIVLLLTIAIGVFSSTMLATISQGQVDAAWQSVGADYAIVAPSGLSDVPELGSLDGVQAVAPLSEFDGTVGIAGGAPVHVVAVDPAAYRDLLATTPFDVRLPSAFFEPPGDPTPGTADAPVPAIISRALVRSSTAPLRQGASFQITWRARFPTFEVSAVVDRWPGVEEGSSFAIVPRDITMAALRGRPLDPTSVLVAGPDGLGPDLRAALESDGVEARVVARDELVGTLRQRPLVEAVQAGFAIAVGLAVAYAALAVIISLVLAAGARARETAQLRTLGLSRSQVVGLAILEHGPPVLVAALAGIGLGVAVGWLLLPGLALGAFTGGAVDPVLTVDLSQLLLVVGALAAIVALGIVAAAWVQRRADPVLVAREGVE